MLSQILKNRALSGVFIGIITTVILSIGLTANLCANLHNNFTNNLYTRNDPSQDIVIIAIDDKSTQPSPEGFGRFNNWTRERFTQLLNVLKEEIIDNIMYVYDQLIHHLPKEKNNINNIFIKFTMSKPEKI